MTAETSAADTDSSKNFCFISYTNLAKFNSCLKNEQETYEELNRRLPGIGDTVTTPDGIQGNVQSVNVLRQLVKVVVEISDEKEIQEFPVGELKFRSRKKKVKVSEQELKELKDLEDKKGDSKLDD